MHYVLETFLLTNSLSEKYLMSEAITVPAMQRNCFCIFSPEDMPFLLRPSF
jgi:hypothetical protein